MPERILNFMKGRYVRGFTLVEIIVTIVIIAVLATIVSIGLNMYLSTARDGQRSSRATVITEGLEGYFDKKGEYPSCSLITSNASVVTNTILKGVSADSLVAPGDSSSVSNSIACETLATSGRDFYQYEGDQSVTCRDGSACLTYKFRYREEVSGDIVELQSRRSVPISTSGIPDISALSQGFSEINVGWNAVQNATGYTMQVARDAGFTTGLITETYQEYSTTVENLAYNTQYFFRVRAESATGSGPWSSVVTESTQALSAATLTVQTVDVDALSASWTAVSGATRYTIQFAKNSTFTSGLVSYTPTGRTQQGTGLDYSTPYYVRVRATWNGNNGPWSNVVTRSTDSLDQSSLTTAATGFTSIRATWGAVTSATSYVLELDTSSSFSSGNKRTVTGTATTQNVSGLLYGTTYYLRVKAMIDTDSGPWSAVVTRATNTVASPDGLTATSVSASQVNLEWDGVGGADQYRVVWSTNSSFSSVTGTRTGLTSPSLNVTGLAAGTNYYFRVFAQWSGNSSAPAGVNGVTYPGSVELTAAMSGTNAVGTAHITCSGATPQYQLRSRETNTSTAGTWSGWSSWSTITGKSVAGTQGYKYDFQAQTRCVQGSAISGTTISGVSGVVRPISAPNAPVVKVPSSSGSSDTVTWSWAAVTCPAGTSAEYQSAWGRDDASDWRAYSSATTELTRAVSTAYQGYQYKVKVQARCVNVHATSGFSGDSNAPTYIRNVEKPGVTSNTTGVATNFAVQTVDKYNDAINANTRWVRVTWTAPTCGPGTTQLRNAWGAFGNKAGGGGYSSEWTDVDRYSDPGNFVEVSKSRWRGATFPIGSWDWSYFSMKNPNTNNVAPMEYMTRYSDRRSAYVDIGGWSPVNTTSIEFARAIVVYGCFNSVTKRVGYYGNYNVSQRFFY